MDNAAIMVVALVAVLYGALAVLAACTHARLRREEMRRQECPWRQRMERYSADTVNRMLDGYLLAEMREAPEDGRQSTSSGWAKIGAREGEDDA